MPTPINRDDQLIRPNLRCLATLAMASALAAALTACSQSPSEAPSPKGAASPESDGAQKAAPGLAAVDLGGRPIAGAKVLIGSAAGVPFANNFVVTAGDGSIPAPPEWNSPLPVTIEAPGFVRATYYGRTPASGRMALRNATANRPQLSGITTGYGPIPNDGWVRVGLVFPAVSRAELGSFQISTFISPQMDTITVAGQSADVPSNVSIPRQRHTYLLTTVMLDKPGYRAFFEGEGTARAVAAHAQFKLSDAVSAIQAGKPFVDLVDLLAFKEASIVDVAIGVDGAAVDLDVRSIPFTSKAQVSSPKYPSQFSALALAINEARGKLYPSDVKKIASGASRQLFYPAGAAPNLAVLLLRLSSSPAIGAAAEQSSIIIGPAAQIGASEYLPAPAPPALRGAAPSPHTIVLSPPASAPRGATAAAAWASLSSVQRTGSGKKESERKTGRWDLYTEGWPTSLDLPAWPIQESPPTGPQRWEAGFIAAPAGSPALIGPTAFERASHVAKSALDF